MIASNGAGPNLLCIHGKFADKANVRADISLPAQPPVYITLSTLFLSLL